MQDDKNTYQPPNQPHMHTHVLGHTHVDSHIYRSTVKIHSQCPRFSSLFDQKSLSTKALRFGSLKRIKILLFVEPLLEYSLKNIVHSGKSLFLKKSKF